MHWIAAYALGVGTAAALRPAVRPLGKRLRPAARSLIKGSIVVTREIRRVAEETSATVGDLVAEAQDELDAAESRPADEQDTAAEHALV